MRARTDLRLGIPIVLAGKKIDAVVTPVEVLNQKQLNKLRQIDKSSFILITARRAQTLKCPIYDGNFVRIELGEKSTPHSVKAIADPMLDLENPLKGPFKIIREMPIEIENEALIVLKSAQLLPAAIISQVNNGENLPKLIS